MQNNVGIYASQISGHLWAPNGAYDALATVTVGSTSVATIDFAGIPQGYKHLQIRGLTRSDQASSSTSSRMRFNSDSGSNYDYHALYGNGSSPAGAENIAPVNVMLIGNYPGASATSGMFGASVIDILDYSSLTKYKTVRFLNGYDNNGSGQVTFGSNLWMNTNAITSISLFPATGNFVQYTQFALYGVK
jgi:hypothetical protein